MSVKIASVYVVTFAGYVKAEPDSFPVEYDLIRICTYGWLQGSRTRTKLIPPEKALPYVKKLHIGGYIDDATHDSLCTLVQLCLFKLKDPEGFHL